MCTGTGLATLLHLRIDWAHRVAPPRFGAVARCQRPSRGCQAGSQARRPWHKYSSQREELRKGGGGKTWILSSISVTEFIVKSSISRRMAKLRKRACIRVARPGSHPSRQKRILDTHELFDHLVDANTLERAQPHAFYKAMHRRSDILNPAPASASVLGIASDGADAQGRTCADRTAHLRAPTSTAGKVVAGYQLARSMRIPHLTQSVHRGVAHPFAARTTRCLRKKAQLLIKNCRY